MSALAASLLEKIESRRARTGVVGLGYVGLPLAVELGKVMLDRELKKYKVSHKLLSSATDNGAILGPFGVSKIDDLYAALGYGKLAARQVIARLAPEALVEKHDSKPVDASAKTRPRPVRETVVVKGHDDMLVTLARCCRPIRTGWAGSA